MILNILLNHQKITALIHKTLKISIITINYNNAKGLNETIKSVVSQNYTNFEFLVIDGGSIDGSMEIIKKYTTKLNYWISEKDTGIYNAMNKGILKATGEYLLFLNSGDILVANSVLDDAVNLGFDADLICGNMVYNNNGIKRDWTPEDKLTFSLFYTSTLPHPSTFIKKELFEKIGLYDDELSIVSDWKFFLLASCKYNCTYKHIHLLIAEFKDDGISSDPKNYAQILNERNQVMAENFSAFLSDYEELYAAKKQLRKLRYTIKIKKFFKLR